MTAMDRWVRYGSDMDASMYDNGMMYDASMADDGIMYNASMADDGEVDQ